MAWSTIFWPLLGGALIGLCGCALLLFNGRILGVAGIFSGIISPKAGDTAWRVAFVVGLIVGALALIAAGVPAFPSHLDHAAPWWIVSGLLVGFGTRLGNGCTSGHGVCGNARLSPRSIVATLTFIAFGAATVYVVKHVLAA